MALSIDVYEGGNTVHRISLGSKSYNMRIYWNTRAGNWGMDVTLSDGTVIAKGVTLVANTSLLAPYSYRGFSGDLTLIKRRGLADEELSYNNLGIDKAYELIWFSEDELSE